MKKIKEEKREKVIVRTSVIGIFINLLLVIFKAIIGLISNSIAILLDAVNNLSDALSSIVTIFFRQNPSTIFFTIITVIVDSI